MSEFLQDIPPWVYHILFAVARWLHIIATALLVGGTLYFEFVVPRAIEEMKMQEQMTLIARLRLAWRQVVWGCAVVLPITGLFSMYHVWPMYMRPDRNSWSAAFPWSMTHMIGGCVIVTLSVALVAGRKVPERARGWLKVNFVVMLAVIFMASASRHVRMIARDHQARVGYVTPTLQPPVSP